jgi:hypothetical protein
MTAARLVLVKGLSNSTSQLNEAGQGTEQPREATRQMMATSAMAPSKSRRTYAAVAILVIQRAS